MSAIQFKGVTKSFRTKDSERLVIDQLDLEIADREFVAVVGPSGSGKTTLLRMAAGLETPDNFGSVMVDGTPVKGPGADRAVVFQNFALMPWKTVSQNIEFGLRCTGWPKRKARIEAQQYIDLMGLAGHENAYPHQLSGGMQQRVAIARSYAVKPEVLLMDEPFGALDAQTRAYMQEELVRLTRNLRHTVFFITHDVGEAIYLADRVVVLSSHPASVKEIVDVYPIREQEGWNNKSAHEVGTNQEFNRIKSHLWRLLESGESEVSDSQENPVPTTTKGT